VISFFLFSIVSSLLSLSHARQVGHTAFDMASPESKRLKVLNPNLSTKNLLALAVRDRDAHKLEELLHSDRSGINQQDSVSLPPHRPWLIRIVAVR
jgi:hypothetical protein